MFTYIASIIGFAILGFVGALLAGAVGASVVFVYKTTLEFWKARKVWGGFYKLIGMDTSRDDESVRAGKALELARDAAGITATMDQLYIFLAEVQKKYKES